MLRLEARWIDAGAHQHQRAADCLLLIAHPVRSQLANFKLYEYLSAGPPILALAPLRASLAIFDEAGFSPVLQYVIKSIFRPSLMLSCCTIGISIFVVMIRF